jgi:hypothetical protein
MGTVLSLPCAYRLRIKYNHEVSIHQDSCEQYIQHILACFMGKVR